MPRGSACCCAAFAAPLGAASLRGIGSTVLLLAWRLRRVTVTRHAGGRCPSCLRSRPCGGSWSRSWPGAPSPRRGGIRHRSSRRRRSRPGRASTRWAGAGKYLLLALDDDRELVVHLGMTGRAPAATRRARPVRAGVVGARRRARARAARRPPLRSHRRGAGGGVRVAADAGRPGPRAVGRGARRRRPVAAHRRRSRARIKTQLLSQRPVAGVGNIYADEALWRAGIHPARRSITRKQADRLLAELRDRPRAGHRQRRHHAPRLPHPRRRARPQPARARRLRPRRRALPPLRHRAAAHGHRRPGHHLLPHLPAPPLTPLSRARARRQAEPDGRCRLHLGRHREVVAPNEPRGRPTTVREHGRPVSLVADVAAGTVVATVATTQRPRVGARSARLPGRRRPRRRRSSTG